MNDFTVTTEQHPDRTVITVAGDIDLHTCPALKQATVTGGPQDGKKLLLELSGVRFMDSSGLHLLLRLRDRLHNEGSRLVIIGLQHQPTRLLHLTDTYSLLTEAA
ncbi:STAS domain-containing protein [Streptomyces sp. NPDC052040]|uniref:STAS domain-containing protein n=1 Tax=unclassified Streptomyces TaxID=2593676 RepID=UPI0037D7E4F3